VQETVAREDSPSRLRVLYLIKGLASGGAERLLLSSALVRDPTFEYEVAYILPSKNDLVGELEAAGVAVHCIGSENEWDVRWAGRLRRMLATGRFDILHSHLPYVAGIGRLTARSLPRAKRPRLIYTQHSVWRYMQAIPRTVNHLTMGLDDAVIAVSNHVRSAMPRRLRPKVTVIVHGVITDELDELAGDRTKTRDELGVSAGEILISTVANFRPEKGHHILFAAAKQLIDEGLPVRFAVVGHGDEAEEAAIRGVHRELELGDRVLLLGFRRDAMRIVAASDIFALSSVHEGFPVSIMEALALGVPVVGTAVGGVPEAVIDGQDGFVVPPGRPDLLAAALRTLVLDDELRAWMSPVARERGRELFDIRRAVRRIEELYRTVVAGRPAPE